MRRIFAVVLLAGFAAPIHAQQSPLPPLMLTATAEIEDAKSLNAGIERISGKVSACVERGGDATACMCREAADIATLKRTYEAVLAKHPAWRGRLVFFKKAEDTHSLHISMPGLEGAFAGCP